MADATPADMSHAMLLAVLMHHGGSLDLPADAFNPAALGGADGQFHAVGLDELPDGRLRLSVRPRPPGDSGGITRYDRDGPDPWNGTADPPQGT